MKEKVVFKSQLKPLLLAIIKEHRTNGGTFSEIADHMNSKKQYTMTGKAWTDNYMYRFFTENQEKMNQTEKDFLEHRSNVSEKKRDKCPPVHLGFKKLRE